MILDEFLEQLTVSPSLRSVIQHLASALAEISSLLRTATVAAIGSHNAFGDAQLTVDVQADDIVLRQCRNCGIIEAVSSEENPTRIDLSTSLTAQSSTSSIASNYHDDATYSVTYDPLDGSSIVDANFSVGSIFSIWPQHASQWINATPSQQSAAMLTAFGPRTTMIIGINSTSSTKSTVFEATLFPSSEWRITKQSIQLSPSTKYFAPANLRAAADDTRYRQLIDHWIDSKLTLRYSGGLVPDINHSLIKGQGVFCSPVTKSSPAKLRLLYECAAVALIVTLANGQAVDAHGNDLMNTVIHTLDQRVGLCAGSSNEVERFVKAMKQQSTAKL